MTPEELKVHRELEFLRVTGSRKRRRDIKHTAKKTRLLMEARKIEERSRRNRGAT